jgi:hypothetical protein
VPPTKIGVIHNPSLDGKEIEPAPPEVKTSSDSRSSVSRMFVARTKDQVKAFLSRPLGGLDLPVIMVVLALIPMTSYSERSPLIVRPG